MVRGAVFFGEMMHLEYSPVSGSPSPRSVEEAMASRSPGNPLEASTRDLLAEVRRGSDDAREALYRRYSDRLARWARGRLPPAARDLVDTDDLVQETLARSLAHVEHFEPRHDGAFQGYLRRGILNRIRDEIRKSRRAPRRDESASQLADPRTISPLERVVGLETIERYDAALERLSPMEREALVGRIELGLSYEELREALGKASADAARMSVSRAILRLSDEMRKGSS